MVFETNAPRIVETDRLTLVPHRLEEFEESLCMWREPEVARYTSGRIATEEDVWARLQRYAGGWALLGFGYWAVRERRTGRFIGEVGFSNFRRSIEPPLGDAPEIGWALVPEAWGQGYATEAVRAAVEWVDRVVGPPRTVCLITEGNMASYRVAERCGYRRYAEARYKEQPVLLYERLSVDSAG